MTPARIAALLLAAAACGGGTPDPSTEPMDLQQHAVASHARPSEGAAAPEGERDHGAHGAMPAPVAKFHDTLAPRWHAAPGPARMTDACAAVAQLAGDAAAIVAAPAPAGTDPAAWSSGGTQLADAVTALDATCKANDAAAFEPAFERVHTRFHQVMEAGSAHHDEH